MHNILLQKRNFTYIVKSWLIERLINIKLLQFSGIFTLIDKIGKQKFSLHRRAIVFDILCKKSTL